MRSAKAALHVLGRAGVGRVGEQPFGLVYLHALARQEECGSIGEPPSLLHQVGHEHDGELVLEPTQDLLDAHGGDRVHGDGELVEQQQLGVLRQRPGDGQSLLLATGQQATEGVQPILDLVPQSSAPQAGLHDAVDVLLGHTPDPRGERHVVVHRQRQAHRQREHHPDLAPQGVQVAPFTNVLAVEVHVAGERHALRELVHAIEHPQERRLAAVGGADDPEDLVAADVEVHPGQRGLGAVADREIADLDLGLVVAHHRLRPLSQIRSPMDSEFITRTTLTSTRATP